MILIQYEGDKNGESATFARTGKDIKEFLAFIIDMVYNILFAFGGKKSRFKKLPNPLISRCQAFLMERKNKLKE